MARLSMFSRRPNAAATSRQSVTHSWTAGATVTVLAVLVGTFVVFIPFSNGWHWQRTVTDPLHVQRLASPAAGARNNSSAQPPAETAPDDYGTVRIGRIVRPARLLTDRTRWVRQVIVPPGGARYDAFVGTFDAPAIVRAGARGTTPLETRAAAGRWTRITVDLSSSRGPRQDIALDVEVPSGALAAWASEMVTPVNHDQTVPDIILISLDTVRRDQLTPYVPSLATTPALATLAQEATVFDNAISTSSWTVGSHATLFTGHFPPDSLGYKSRVEPAEETLPELFSARGYRSLGVSGGPYTDPHWGLHQGFDEYVVSAERENARDATSRAVDWMEKTGDTAPVFLFLNYFNAHEPLDLSPEVKALTGVHEDVPLRMWSDLDEGRAPITDAVRRRLVRAYRAELTAIDRELGRLFEYLKQTGRWQRTLVIVWGDHGQLLGERTHIGHALTLEEELLRVPLMIKAPSGARLNAHVYSGLIQNDDLFALVQSLAGVRSPRGEEILAAVNRDAPIRRWAFSKIHHDPLPALTGSRRWRSATQWAISDGAVKVVRDLEGRSVAYDVTGTEERPIPTRRLDVSLIAALDQFRVWSERGATPTAGPLSPAEVERLRSLGYVQ